MLPENLHIDEIKRFHQTMKSLNERIKEETDITTKRNLSIQYFYMDELWREIDDFITFKIKSKLDSLENNEPSDVALRLLTEI